MVLLRVNEKLLTKEVFIMEPIDIAKDTLLSYGIENAELTLLRHNENQVWKVECSEGLCYVLRIHLPASGLAVIHREDWLESEMIFLNNLSNDCDIHVQKPIRTKDGRYVSQLPLNGAFATLLSWLPGETFNQLEDSAIHNAFLVGELVAHMHEHALKYPDGDKLSRPTYNAERVLNAVKSLEEGVGMGLLTKDMYTELREGAMCICKIMERENSREGWHGLIHSDLGLGNIIIHDGIVSPIDFGLCGHGPFLFDLGGLMGTFDHAHLRKAVIDGYSRHRPLNHDDYRSIEAFFIASIFFFMSMHLHNTNIHEWFRRRLPLIISDYVHPFINENRFLHKLIV
jgi:Ser/Thr protein kinase RdoA (MazF antagonist)